MKRQILLIIILMLMISFTACKKIDVEKNTPTCVENLIQDFDKEQTCDTDVNVKKYTFQGTTVYVFDPGTCGADMTSEVIDFECNSIGFLGGFSGNTVINGEDFSNATLESITWENRIMRTKITILLVAILTTFISCSKVNDKNMIVIKDCTGSYLRFEGNDYHICNIEMVENYDSWTEVEASFKKIDECSEGDVVVCDMFHQNEGLIRVTKIK